MRYLLLCAAAATATAAVFPFAALADDAQPGDKVEWKPAAQAPSDSSPAPVSTTKPANTGSHFGLSVAGGFEFGGDDLATVYFTDGSSTTLHAGQGLLISVGGHYQPSKNSPWDVMLTAGYKYDHAGADNGDVSFDHIPVELIGSYQWSNGIRVGVGPVYHTNVEFKGSGDLGSQPTLKYNNAFGGEVQLGWKFVALTYTFISYEPSEPTIMVNGFPYNTLKINGDNFGVRFFYNF